jgi:hypothetical protein
MPKVSNFPTNHLDGLAERFMKLDLNFYEEVSSIDAPKDHTWKLQCTVAIFICERESYLAQATE